MFRYISRRVLLGLVSLVVFTFVMFWLVEILIPGDFFSTSRLFLSAEEVAALRAEFGVDRPIYVRWWRWLGGFLTGGLGTSTIGFGVSGPLTDALSRTVFVFAAGLLVAYAVGQWLGRFTGWRRGLISDGVTLGSIGISTLFPPFLGFLFITFVGVRLRTVRAQFFEETRRQLWTDAPYSEPQLFDRMSLALVVAAIVAMVVSAIVWRRRRRRLPMWAATLVVAASWSGIVWALGIGPWAVDLVFDSGLALGAFVVLAFGEFLLIMQAGMVSTLHDDYIVTARAKGLRPRTIRDRHAARNASLAVVARLAVSIPYLLTGLVIIETAVGFSGVGDFLFTAIDSQDVPLAVSTLAVIGFITMIVRLVLDILIAILDPRIAIGRSKA
jgi:peptide/nickel transport system permease protein